MNIVERYKKQSLRIKYNLRIGEIKRKTPNRFIILAREPYGINELIADSFNINRMDYIHLTTKDLFKSEWILLKNNESNNNYTCTYYLTKQACLTAIDNLCNNLSTRDKFLYG